MKWFSFCFRTEPQLEYTKPPENRSKRSEVSPKPSSKGLQTGTCHFPPLLASRESVLEIAGLELKLTLEIAGNLTLVFGCEKRRDLVETNLGYFGERKFYSPQ